jgi:hypothetical protein
VHCCIDAPESLDRSVHGSTHRCGVAKVGSKIENSLIVRRRWRASTQRCYLVPGIKTSVHDGASDAAGGAADKHDKRSKPRCVVVPGGVRSARHSAARYVLATRSATTQGGLPC